MPHADSAFEELPSDSVLIVGGGPVGLILALTLAHHGVRSVLVERNLTTTRVLGIADGLRERGVPSHYPFTCLFSSGLNAEKALTSWELPSVDEFRSHIGSCNDGTVPLEPWQRISQEVFEAWLKDLGDQNPLIDIRFGWTAVSAKELDGGAEVVIVDTTKGVEKIIRGKYAVGCDGANSVLRKSLGIEMEGGPMYVANSTDSIPSYLM
jgi:FAD-dependent monooxygenase